MSECDDGGAAFPLDVNADTTGAVNVGMSLRDYFAAAALQGMTNGLENAFLTRETTEETCDMMILNCAALSYRLADAMIRERNK